MFENNFNFPKNRIIEKWENMFVFSDFRFFFENPYQIERAAPIKEEIDMPANAQPHQQVTDQPSSKTDLRSEIQLLTSRGQCSNTIYCASACQWNSIGFPFASLTELLGRSKPVL